MTMDDFKARGDAMALGIVNVCMSEFAASIIRHSLRHGTGDEQFLIAARKIAIKQAKDTATGLDLRHEAEVLIDAVCRLDHLIDLAICSGRDLRKGLAGSGSQDS
jgi:hypothetical protein